jgi:hypothetical protein
MPAMITTINTIRTARAEVIPFWFSKRLFHDQSLPQLGLKAEMCNT